MIHTQCRENVIMKIKEKLPFGVRRGKNNYVSITQEGVEKIKGMLTTPGHPLSTMPEDERFLVALAFAELDAIKKKFRAYDMEDLLDWMS